MDSKKRTAQSKPSSETRKILTNKQLLFSFDGRITRKTYWYTTLSLGLVSIIVANALTLACLMISHSLESIRNPDLLMAIYAVVIAPFVIMVSFASLAIQAKRWHDINKSGWCSIIAVIPVVGVLLCIKALGFTPSDVGSNDYGQPQKDSSVDTFVTPSIKELLLSFHGRVNRSTYWIIFAATVAISSFIDFVWVFTPIYGEFVDAFLLLCLWPVIVMVIKRLHDSGLSGWHGLWVFAPYVGFGFLVHYLGFLVHYIDAEFFYKYYTALVYSPYLNYMSYLGFIAVLAIGFSVGNDGNNKYGLPQKPL